MPKKCPLLRESTIRGDYYIKKLVAKKLSTTEGESTILKSTITRVDCNSKNPMNPMFCCGALKDTAPLDYSNQKTCLQLILVAVFQKTHSAARCALRATCFARVYKGSWLSMALDLAQMVLDIQKNLRPTQCYNPEPVP